MQLKYFSWEWELNGCRELATRKQSHEGRAGDWTSGTFCAVPSVYFYFENMKNVLVFVITRVVHWTLSGQLRSSDPGVSPTTQTPDWMFIYRWPPDGWVMCLDGVLGLKQVQIMDEHWDRKLSGSTHEEEKEYNRSLNWDYCNISISPRGSIKYFWIWMKMNWTEYQTTFKCVHIKHSKVNEIMTVMSLFSWN